jgi:predicted AlkP superfamily pyrophosphatase or phosphodiesterase
MVVSIDGLRPDLIFRADAPTLQAMIRSGAFSLWAKTTPVAITLPSHVSMLTGVVPEEHGVHFNGDAPPPEAKGVPRVPTLFTLAHDAGYTTALAAGKSKFSAFDSPTSSGAGSVDWRWLPTTSKCEDEDVAVAAIAILREHRPDVMFVHFAIVDSVGHAKGWGGEEQLQAVAGADTCLGKLLDVTRELGLADSTLVIVSADHGGAGRTHGADDARSRTIPWIAVGPGVRKNYDLTRLGRDHDVQTYDTFATAAAVLGIPVTRKVDGKFIVQAFEGLELMTPTTQPAAKAAK